MLDVNIVLMWTYKSYSNY